MTEKIGRAEKARLILEEGEWRTPPEPQSVDVIHALDNKIRRDILRRLERPMRKFELAEYVHSTLGKKYSRSLVHHHLELLERAGLIKYGTTPESPGTKLVYRTADVRVQLRPRVRAPGELAEKLRRVYEK